MSQDKVIVMVGLPTLVTAGLKGLVKNMSDVRVISYASLQDYQSSGDLGDGFVVSTEEFTGNIDFFIPRRHKTLIYGIFTNQKVNERSRLLGIYDDETEIGEKMATLIDSLDASSEDKGDLSGREKEVLRLLAKGKINKEIADELCISVNTVITHRKNISAKTGIKSLSGLSIYAVMNGIS